MLGAPYPIPASPPLTLTQWCTMGFDADVAHALMDGRAVPADLAADPPRTFRAVMSSLGQWVGSATGADTRLLARGSFDSNVLAALRPSAVMAQTPSAANYQKGSRRALPVYDPGRIRSIRFGLLYFDPGRIGSIRFGL